MKRIFLSSCVLALAVAGMPAGGLANSGRYAAAPPVLLSADRIDPWVMQLRPGSRRVIPTDKRARVNKKYYQNSSSASTRQPSQKAHKPARSIQPRFLPTVVDYHGPHKPGTIIVNTNERYLYLVNDDGTARRYGVGVGRPGFEWAGTHKVTRKAEWPSWRPPAEMRQRQPGLPVFMEGGPRNPLGARALYLGSTLYRIHGSNEPWSIGQAVSSGCIRMRNQDVTDLYDRVRVGTRVVVI